MNKLNSMTNKLGYVDYTFRFLYLFLVFISFCGWTAGTPYVSKFALAVTLFAGVVVLYKLFFYKKFIKDKYHIILLFFILSHILSSIMNRQYGLGGNIKATIWFFALFIGVGSFNIEASLDKIYHKLDKIIYLFLGFNFIMLVGSMYYLITIRGVFNYIDRVAKKVNFIGMLWGRLWGIFTDPNYGGVLQVIVILLSLYYVKKTRSKLEKLFHYLQIVMAILYYSFSNSRTAVVTAVVVAFVYSFITYYKEWKKVTKYFILYFCIIYTIGGIMPKVIQFYMNSNLFAVISNIDQESLGDRINKFENEKAKREKEINEDLSNRRFELWKSAAEIGKSSPIWGVSNRNVVAYSLDRLPETYMINNSLGSQFNSSHNLIIDVWMSQGLFGLGLMITLAVFFIFDFFKVLKKGSLDFRMRIILTSVIGLLASSFFIPDLVYVNSIGSYIFWTLMGFFIYFIQLKKRRK